MILCVCVWSITFKSVEDYRSHVSELFITNADHIPSYVLQYSHTIMLSLI